MKLNSRSSVLGAALVLGVLSGCGPGWKVLKASDPTTLGAAANEFNFTLFSASDAAAAQVIAEAQQVSMLSPRRLIRVKEAGQFSKEDQEQLSAYCKKPVPSFPCSLM